MISRPGPDNLKPLHVAVSVLLLARYGVLGECAGFPLAAGPTRGADAIRLSALGRIEKLQRNYFNRVPGGDNRSGRT